MRFRRYAAPLQRDARHDTIRQRRRHARDPQIMAQRGGVMRGEVRCAMRRYNATRA